MIQSKKNKKGHVIKVGNVYTDNDPRSNVSRDLVVLDFDSDPLHGQRAVLRVDVGGRSTGRRAKIQISRLGTEAKNGYRLVREGSSAC